MAVRKPLYPTSAAPCSRGADCAGIASSLTALPCLHTPGPCLQELRETHQKIGSASCAVAPLKSASEVRLLRLKVRAARLYSQSMCLPWSHDVSPLIESLTPPRGASPRPSAVV